MKEKELKVGIFDPEIEVYARVHEAREGFMVTAFDQNVSKFIKDLMDSLFEEVKGEFEGRKPKKKGKTLEEIAEELKVAIVQTIEAKGLVDTGAMRDSVTIKKEK